jgi:nitroreductase
MFWEVPLPTHPPLDDILEHACRAPSVHNTQPWRWHVDGPEVVLYADRARRLDVADPSGRDLLISCGAALHHLQVAAAGLGWSTRVTRLPDPTDQDLLALVRLRPSSIAPEQVALLRALQHRRTDRRSFGRWPVPTERLHRLAAVGAAWGAQVLPVESSLVRAQLERLTRRARVIQDGDRRYVEELQSWTRSAKDEGIPAANLPVGQTTGSGVGVLTAVDTLNRPFPSGDLPDAELGYDESSDGSDSMLLVCTSSDDTISRLRSGESLSAVWLAATLDGLAAVPLSQALEVDETRRELQSDVLDDLACPQILLRVGWPPMTRDTQVPPTPRRPLADVVVRA